MSGAQVLQTIFLWTVFGVQHSFFAQPYFKNIIARIFGTTFLNHGYRFVYFVSQAIVYAVFWILIVQMNDGQTIWTLPPALQPWHFGLRVSGHLLIVSSLLAADVNYFTGVKPLWIYFRSRMRGETTLPLESVDAKKMSRSFPFSMVRHPMYLGIFLSLLATTTIYSEKTFLNLFCLLVYIELGSFFEERQLVRVFGRDYLEYQEATPKYLPLFGTNILSQLRRLTIRLTLPLFWKGSRKRTAVALSKFATTEFDGAWQGLYAIENVTDPLIRAQIFQHSLEEFHHGALFRKIADKYSSTMPGLIVEERTPLFKGATEVEGMRRFYSSEYVGEVAVRDEFRSYAAACPHKDIKHLFQRLSKDERNHVDYTRRVYKQVIPSGARREYYSAQVQLKRLYEAWCRVGIALGAVTSTIVLGTVYYLFGGFTKISNLSQRKMP